MLTEFIDYVDSFYGQNDTLYHMMSQQKKQPLNKLDIERATQNYLVTAASCTTNCVAPIVKVIHDNLKINHGSITTIHNITNSQTIIDKPSSDLRRSRASMTNLIPTTTGSAKAINLIYPELKGNLNVN